MVRRIIPRTPATPAAPVAPATPATPPTPPVAPATPIAPATPRVNPKDPVELQLFKSQLLGGNFSLFARVLNIADKGLKKLSIVFTLEGRQVTVITNDQGDASFPDPLTAPADGKELKVSAHISGIRHFSVAHILKRVDKTPAQKAKDLANNKRARKFIFVTAGLWLTCLLIALFFGLGNPLIDFPQTKLTDQQVFFNNLPGVKGSASEIHPDSFWKSSFGVWQKPFFLVVLLWTIFSIFYGILAFREEVIEEFRRGIEKLVDKYYNTSSARDPLLERLLAFSGHLTSARRSTTAGAAEPAATGKATFWELFRSDLLSDFLIEIVPGILKTIRR